MTDTYFNANVGSLLHFENSLRDEAGAKWYHYCGLSGDFSISDSTSMFGSTCAEFSGGSYLSTSNGTSHYGQGFAPIHDISSGDFTIECGFNLKNVGTNYGALMSWVDDTNTKWYGLYIKNDGTALKFEYFNGTTLTAITYTGTISVNAWHSVSAVKNGTTLTLYLDGTNVASDTVPTTFIMSSIYTQQLNIGNQCNASNVGSAWYNGYIDELRITQSVVRYTSNYTPSTTAFDPTPSTDDSSSLISTMFHFDNSIEDRSGQYWTNNGVSVVTSGSFGSAGYFNGSSAYLSLSGSSDVLNSRRLYKSNFTIEAFINIAGASNESGGSNAELTIVSNDDNSSNKCFIFSVKADRSALLFNYSADSGSTYTTVTGTYSFALNTEYHVAVTRNELSLTLWVNGTSVATSTLTTGTSINYASANSLTIGARSTAGVKNFFNGTIDEFVITNFLSKYNSTFTPTTSAFTPIFNTAQSVDFSILPLPDMLFSTGRNISWFYNKLQSSVDITNYATDQFANLPISGVSANTNFTIQADIMIVSDNTGTKNAGLYLFSPTDYHIKADHYNNQWEYSEQSNNYSGSTTTITTGGVDWYGSLPLNTRVTVKAVYGTVNGKVTVYMFVNNVLSFVATASHAQLAGRKPGFFTYQGTLRIFNYVTTSTDINTINPFYNSTVTSLNGDQINYKQIVSTTSTVSEHLLYRMPKQSDFYTMGASVISGFIEGTSIDEDVVLCDQATLRPLQSINLNNYTFNVNPNGKYVVKYNNAFLKTPILKKVTVGQTMAIGSISGHVSTSSCPSNSFYIKCFRTYDDIFIGYYYLDSGGYYTIPNLDVGSSYDVILVDANGLVEDQVMSMRAGDGTAFQLINVDLNFSALNGSSAMCNVIYHPSIPGDRFFGNITTYLNFDNSSDRYRDLIGNTWTANGTVSFETTSPIMGTSSLSLNGVANNYIKSSVSTGGLFDMTGVNYTIEIDFNCYGLPSNGNSQSVLLAATPVPLNASNEAYMVYLKNDGTEITFEYGSGGGVITNHISTSFTLNANHTIAISRIKDTIYAFLDGILINTTTSAPAQRAITSGSQIMIGDNAGGFPFYGLIDNIRITRGIGRYSLTYTPTYQIYPVKSQYDYLYDRTSLLLSLNGTNGDITFSDDSINSLIATSHGGAALTNTQVPPLDSQVTTSLSLDGSTKYLTIPSDASLNFGSGDFTIEAWVYFNSLSNDYQGIIANGYNPSWTDGCVSFLVNGTASSPSSRVRIAINSGGSDVGVSHQTTFTTGMWHHVAVTRQSSVVRVFYDGIVSSSTSSTSAIVDFSHITTHIGNSGWDGAPGFMNGYIAQLRATKGVARYVNSFVVPSGANPTKGFDNGASLLWTGGTTLSGWTNGGASLNSTGGISGTGSIAVSPAWNYAYINPLGSTDLTGKSIKFDCKIGSNGLCNFFVCSNLAGNSGIAFRIDSRAGANYLNIGTIVGWNTGPGSPYPAFPLSNTDNNWHEYQFDIKTSTTMDVWIDGIVVWSDIIITQGGGYLGMNGDAGSAGAEFSNMSVFTI